MKYVNLVYVTHENRSKRFMFELPLSIAYGHEDIGKKVACQTMYGEKYGEIASENMIIPEALLSAIATGSGAYLPLKKVIGAVETVQKEEVRYFESVELPF